MRFSLIFFRNAFMEIVCNVSCEFTWELSPRPRGWRVWEGRHFGWWLHQSPLSPSLSCTNIQSTNLCFTWIFPLYYSARHGLSRGFLSTGMGFIRKSDWYCKKSFEGELTGSNCQARPGINFSSEQKRAISTTPKDIEALSMKGVSCTIW